VGEPAAEAAHWLVRKKKAAPRAAFPDVVAGLSTGRLHVYMGGFGGSGTLAFVRTLSMIGMPTE